MQPDVIRGVKAPTPNSMPANISWARDCHRCEAGAASDRVTEPMISYPHHQYVRTQCSVATTEDLRLARLFTSLQVGPTLRMLLVVQCRTPTQDVVPESTHCH